MRSSCLFLVFVSIYCLMLSACKEDATSRTSISLAGEWAFHTDPENIGEKENWFTRTLEDKVVLPGTMDTNKKGNINENRDETSNLSREYTYTGKAWYQKRIEIPSKWAGENIRLVLERTKPSKVWIDGVLTGSSDDISTAQVYDLTGYLTPGEHTITVMIDNGESVPPQLLQNSHAYTESTQTNWNGIIGQIELQTQPKYHIEKIQVYTDIPGEKATIRISMNNLPSHTENLQVELNAKTFNTSEKYRLRQAGTVRAAGQVLEMELPLKGKMALWSEYDPALYELTVTVRGDQVYDRIKTTFGVRDFKTKGTQFTINGLTTFLRGKHDACVFPLTGHVAMDVDSWQEYFRIAKSYGINHYRFHSWCPPEACFIAADLEGIYLQPELPFWGSLTHEDPALVNFLTKEGILIQQSYSDHPSFVMFALGNELFGEQEIMSEMIRQFKNTDDRHLYAIGSNNFLGYQGYVEQDDYFTTCRVPGENIPANHTRGSFSFADAEEGGSINNTYPNSVMNFDNAVQQIAVPIISHESGQFQIYPDYNEIEKYKGVLKPWNFEVFKKRLEEAGMGNQAHDFFLASGKWSVALYRADIEMGLRTAGFGGFQLLDLQDYPGQGSAFVGILDAFMDSKGLVTPEEWREFCSEVVPLFITEKFCYSNNEPFTGEIKIANYSEKALEGKHLKWTLVTERGDLIETGSLPVEAAQGTLADIGHISSSLTGITEAEKLILTLEIEKSNFRNSYDLWVYPSDNQVNLPDEIKIYRNSINSQMIESLRKGEKVLWFPDANLPEGVTVGGLFQTDYWNYRMFKSICEWVDKPVSPGTLGILVDPAHPLFGKFPTEFHSNWQWYPVVKKSYPLIIDRLPADYKPIVQVIDNVERNHKLGLILELNIGKGKLLICMSNLESVQDKPEARQFYTSIVSYMQSGSFNPSLTLSEEELQTLFTTPLQGNEIRELGNISYTH